MQCTPAFTVASATTMVLELDICNVNMLVIGGGGVGKSMPCTKYTYNCMVISPKSPFSFTQVAKQALLEVGVEERASSINGAMEVEL